MILRDPDSKMLRFSASLSSHEAEDRAPDRRGCGFQATSVGWVTQQPGPMEVGRGAGR